VRDEPQLAGRNGREPDAVGVRLGAHEDAHRQSHGRLGLDAHGRRRGETTARTGRRPGRILTNDDRAAVGVQKRDHAIERPREDPLGVGDTDDRVRDLVHRAHLVEVLALGAFTFVERGGHRVERALERPDLVCGHLLHAGGEIAGLDPLRG